MSGIPESWTAGFCVQSVLHTHSKVSWDTFQLWVKKEKWLKLLSLKFTPRFAEPLDPNSPASGKHLSHHKEEGSRLNYSLIISLDTGEKKLCVRRKMSTGASLICLGLFLSFRKWHTNNWLRSRVVSMCSVKVNSSRSNKKMQNAVLGHGGNFRRKVLTDNPQVSVFPTVQHPPRLFRTATGNNGALDLCVLVRRWPSNEERKHGTGETSHCYLRTTC